MNSKLLWFFFITSVWLLMGESLYYGVYTLINYKEVLASYPAASAVGKTGALILGPMVLFGMEFTFWYMFFRYPTDGARIFAAFMGIAILLKVIFVNYVVADLLYPDKELPIQWLYWYIVIGHLTFALFGKDKRDVESTFIYYE